MKLPTLEIAGLKPRHAIIQGGMAIRISGPRLAAAVAKCGGIGVIAASGLEDDELSSKIKQAKEESAAENGIIAINIMVAARRFFGVVNCAIDSGIDLIIAGAGFSRDLFKICRERNVPVVPIVSSVALAKVAEKLGADAIIVEGAEAGGHLGTDQSCKVLLPKIKKAVSIPVIGAGGIVDAADIADMIQLGADGVQMGTRFAATVECDAADSWKQAYVDAKEGDVVKFLSPVGLPGNAINVGLVPKILDGTVPKPAVCDLCLKKCGQQFCIIEALINAQEGDIEKGIVFSGNQVHRVNDILTVEEIFKNLLYDLERIP